MNNISGSGELGIYVRTLRDRANAVRRLARDMDNQEAAKSLHKHADALDRKAAELEGKISAF